MARKPKPTEAPTSVIPITHFMVTGALPLEGVGFVLAEMYQRGAVHFEHAPFFMQPPQPAQPAQVNHGLAHEEPLRLPAPKPQKKSQLKADIVASCVAAVMAGHDKPVSVATIKQALISDGFSPSSTSGAIFRAMHMSLIKRVGTGLYLPDRRAQAYRAKANRASKTGKTVSSGARRGTLPEGQSQRQYTSGIIERAYPAWVTYKELAAAFERQGLRPGSCSVSLAALKKAGKVRSGTSKGTYQWVPENEPQQTTTSE